MLVLGEFSTFEGVNGDLPFPGLLFNLSCVSVVLRFLDTGVGESQLILRSEDMRSPEIVCGRVSLDDSQR